MPPHGHNSAQHRRMVMLGDSVCLNFPQAVDPALAALVPEEERLSEPFPQLVAHDLSAELHAPVDLVWMAAVLQTIKGSQRRLPEVAQVRPDFVVVAHGGQESILVPPRLLRRLPSIPMRPRFARSDLLDRLLGIAHLMRCLIWRFIGERVKHSPERAVLILRRLGFVNKITSADYSRRLAEVVDTLLVSTDAIIALVGSPACHVGMHVVDPQEIVRNDAAAEHLAQLHPGRVVFCPRPVELDDRSLFMPDAAHLTGSGHRAVSQAVMAAVCSSRLLADLRS